MIVAVSAEDCGYADEPFAITEAAFPNVCAAKSDDEFVGDRRICFEKPWNAVQLGITLQGHIVEHVDKLLVWSTRGLDFELLNRNLKRLETGLANEIRIASGSQIMESLFNLNERQVELMTRAVLLQSLLAAFLV